MDGKITITIDIPLKDFNTQKTKELLDQINAFKTSQLFYTENEKNTRAHYNIIPEQLKYPIENLFRCYGDESMATTKAVNQFIISNITKDKAYCSTDEINFDWMLTLKLHNVTEKMIKQLENITNVLLKDRSSKISLEIFELNDLARKFESTLMVNLVQKLFEKCFNNGIPNFELSNITFDNVVYSLSRISAEELLSIYSDIATKLHNESKN